MADILATAGAHVIRNNHLLRYQGTAHVTTIIEPPRQNQNSFSRDFTNTSIYTRLALTDVTANAIIGPDGVTVDTQQLVEDTANAAHGISRNFSTYGFLAGSYQCDTVIAKYITGRPFLYGQFAGLDGVQRRSWADVQNQAAGTIGSGHFVFIEPLVGSDFDVDGHEYVMIHFVWPTNSGPGTPTGRIVVAQSNAQQTYTGNGADGVYLGWWDHQLNLTYPHPTLPILTAGVPASRAGDVVSSPYTLGMRQHSKLIAFIERGTIMRANGTIVYYGDSGNTGCRLAIEAVGGFYRVAYYNGTNPTPITSTMQTAPAWGDKVELLVHVFYDEDEDEFTVQLWQSINGGTDLQASLSDPVAANLTFSDSLEWYGSKGGTEFGCVAFLQRESGEEAIADAEEIASFANMRITMGAYRTV